jgi:hypothetical protein
MALTYQKIISEQDTSFNSVGDAYAQPGFGTENTTSLTITDEPSNIVIQQFPVGFGSYLEGILPPDLATACGAFSVSMQQIKNISSIPIEKFAQVVTSVETTAGLNLTTSSVPVDRTLVSESLPLIALGSGPYGTYTMSDFFGCMSGLPYIGIDIRGLIQAIETPTLYNIYKQLYLAVTWERATATIQYTYDGISTYTTTGVTLTNPGGGYATAPIVTVNGATVTATIGTDDTQVFPSTLITAGNFVVGKTYSIVSVGSTNFTLIGATSNTVGLSFIATGVGAGTGTANDITTSTFGRITALNFTPSTSGSIPTISIAYPPPGGPSFSNSNVQGYIDAANAEILAIQTSKQRLSEQMNSNWNDTGTQLTIEQRALDTGLPVPVPPALADVVPDLAQFPTTQIAFTDSVPQFALNTDPHMQAQTIEAIANICLPGGQSIVGMMREVRNQIRLTEVGIPLDNNINDSIPPVQNKELVANGSVANSAPATLAQVNCNTGDEINPNPYGFYDPTNNNYYVTNPDFGGSNLVPPVDTGNAEALGSFAGSPYTNLIPTNLNTLYTSKNLLPSTYTVPQAIDEVIRCNCDCWDLV